MHQLLIGFLFGQLINNVLTCLCDIYPLSAGESGWYTASNGNVYFFVLQDVSMTAFTDTATVLCTTPLSQFINPRNDFHRHLSLSFFLSLTHTITLVHQRSFNDFSSCVRALPPFSFFRATGLLHVVR